VAAGISVDKDRGEARTSKHQRVGASEHGEVLHRHVGCDTADEGAMLSHAPAKTSGLTASSSSPPGTAVTASARFPRGFTSGTFP